jgi:hypothetical protein
MATNTLVPATWVSRKSLSILHMKASAAARVDRDYEKDFQPIGGVPRGTTITVRLPFKYLTASGNALSAQNSVQRTASLTVNQLNIGVNFSSVERAQDLGDFAEQVLEPAMSQLGGQIEGNLLANTIIAQIPKIVGTNSTTTAVTFGNVLSARQFLTQALAPTGDSRTLLVDPQHNVDFVSSNAALFNPQVSISDQWVEGLIAEKVAGFMAIENTKLPGITTGVYGTSTPVLNGTQPANAGTGNAYVSTMTVTMSGWASGGTTLNAGDVFCISNVFDVDPETKASLGRLKQFVVTTQVSDSSGTVTATFAPAAIYGGAYQNVSAAPATNAPILTAQGAAISAASGGGLTFRQSVAMARDAILFASVPMENLSNVSPYYAQETFDGFTLRVASIYDVNNDFIPLRLDVLVGQALAYPEVAVRVLGQ